MKIAIFADNEQRHSERGDVLGTMVDQSVPKTIHLLGQAHEQ
jgi:hypothetical protein